MSEEKIPSQHEKQVSHVRDAIAEGARLLTGGERHPAGVPIPFGGMKQCDLKREGARQGSLNRNQIRSSRLTIEHSTNRLTNQVIR